MTVQPLKKDRPNIINRTLSYLDFYFKAITLNSIHSPFLFKLLSEGFDTEKLYYDYQVIESIRAQYLENHNPIIINDLGAGSSSKTNDRTISSIAKSSSSNVNKCRLLANLTRFFSPQRTLELGTNLGLSTAYLMAGYNKTHLDTVEGDKSLHNMSKSAFKSLGLDIKVHNLPFKQFLDSSEAKTYDFAFIDGNHTYKATLFHFDKIFSPLLSKQVLIFDDIYWSKGMTKAWEEIKAKIDHGFTIDIFTMGIVCYDTEYPTSKHIRYIPRKLKPWSLGLFG